MREIFIAFSLGATHLSDIFYVAFRIPNFLRDIVAENAVQTAVVPSFLKWQREKKEKELTKVLFTFFFLFSFILTLLGVLFAPFLVNIFAYGFKELQWKYTFTVSLTRIIFPFLIFISLVSFLSGILNARKKFFIPSFSPAIFNSGFLIVGIVAYFFTGKLSNSLVFFLGVGVLAGAFFQTLILLFPFKKERLPLAFSVKITKEKLKDLNIFIRLLTPVVLASSLSRIVLLFATFLASFLGKGAISILNYSYRIMHIPIAFFGVGISTVTLPDMTKIEKKEEFLSGIYKEGIMLLLPVIIFFITDAEYVVSLFYKRGAFDELSSLNTSICLIFYSFGILPFSLSRINLNYFYAQNKIIEPNLSFLFATTGYLFSAPFLMKLFGIYGLALSSSFSSFLQWLYLLKTSPSLLKIKGLWMFLVALLLLGWILHYKFFSYIILELAFDGILTAIFYLLIRRLWR